MSSKAKILYVDDELINLKVFEINFQQKYDVLTAENAVIGLELLSLHSDIKIVISDMRMPIMNGVAFISKVKSIDPQIHCYILTGFELDEQAEKCLESGLILEYFTKPFSTSDIGSSMEKAIEMSQK